MKNPSDKKLYTPMLSIAGSLIYNKNLSKRLWSILYRSSIAARKYKTNMIREGKQLTLKMDGQPKGNSKITFVLYHVPIAKAHNNLIETFDIMALLTSLYF